MERVYVVPLKKGWMNASRWRRAKRAINYLREFALRHMKGKEVVIDPKVNEIIWSRGAKNPPRRIKVLMRKEKDIVYITLPGEGHEVRSEGNVQNEGQVAEVQESSGSQG